MAYTRVVEGTFVDCLRVVQWYCEPVGNAGWGGGTRMLDSSTKASKG